MKKILLTLSIFGACSLQAQVVINEYSGANMSQHNDNYGQNEDWIELYNTTGSAVSLTGWFLSDKASNPDKFTVPAGVSIPANGFMKVYCSGRAEFSGGNIHTNFKLTQTKPEQIILSNPGGTIVDQVTMVPNQMNHSRGRTTDGASTWSVFTTPTQGASNSGSTAFMDYATKPTMNQAPGFYTGTISVTLTSAGNTIYYTLDGTTPTTASTVYSTPISISTTTVVKALAVSSSPSVPNSFVETNTYFIGADHGIATISLSGDLILNLFNGSYGEPDCVAEYFDPSGTFKTEVSGQGNKHGNDSWAYQQRGIDFVGRDQYGINYGLTEKLFHNRDRDEFQRIILKAAANDNYPFEGSPNSNFPGELGGAHIRDAYVHYLAQEGGLHVDARSFEPCILYVNGQYWGVYEIREKVDDADYTSHYYNQDQWFYNSPNDIQFIKTWGGTWEEYGAPNAINDWNALRNFITTNNMGVAANWEYVDSLYNWKSLADYVVLNSYIVTTDWLNWNTAWWRGLNPNGDKKKWRYALWDNDAAFQHYINYTGVPDQTPGADPCNADNLPDPGGQGHIEILNKLMDESPEFKQWYISRYIDLSNTIFSCDRMTTILDSCIALIAPEMPDQIAKWGGTVAEWQGNVTALRNFIIARCDSIQDGLKDCYTLTGPYNITFRTDPPGVANMDVNSIFLDVADLSYTGTYYGGIDVLLKTASVDPEYVFDYWEVTSGTLSLPSDSAENSAQFTGSGEVIAHYKTPIALFVPTAFSPNGDGVNDYFQILGEGIIKLNFAIYDRWGEKLFSTTDPTIQWDGRYKGELLSSGVYAYKLYAVLADETEYNQGGNITIVR